MTELEIRAAREEEMPEFRRVAATSLLVRPELLGAMRPEWTLCAFADGKLATTYAAWPLTMCFNGNDVPLAGVTSVSTLPLYRRRGHLRKIVETHFRRLYEGGGQPLAALFASLAAIYQRYGYAVVGTQNAYAVEPQHVRFAHAQQASGTWREAADEDFGLLVDLYRRFRAGRTGCLHRGRAMWEAGVLAAPPPEGYHTVVVYEEGGEQLGYLAYTVEPQHLLESPVARQRLVVRDLVWLAPGAYRAAWEYLARMDLVSRIQWPRVPSDDPLPHLLLEPRQLNLTARDGLLARIVDVRRALPARPYAAAAELTFELRDETCPWNAGRWKLETSGPESALTPTAAGAQLTLSASTLALLVCGQLRATEAWRMGRLDVQEQRALALWDVAMQTAHRPFCPDSF